LHGIIFKILREKKQNKTLQTKNTTPRNPIFKKCGDGGKVIITVAHTCNPSYLGGRGRRMENSRPMQAKFQTLISKTKYKPKSSKALS
jgi:hypothetical protein